MSRAALQRASGARRRKRYVREHYKWLRPFRRALVLVFVLALTSVGLSLLLPLATRHVIDKVLPASQLSEEEKLRGLCDRLGAGHDDGAWFFRCDALQARRGSSWSARDTVRRSDVRRRPQLELWAPYRRRTSPG